MAVSTPNPAVFDSLKARTLKWAEEGAEWKGYAVASLRYAFEDFLAKGNHWKQRLDAVIPRDKWDICAAASEYFHGCKLHVRERDNEGGLLFVQNAGYQG